MYVVIIIINYTILTFIDRNNTPVAVMNIKLSRPETAKKTRHTLKDTSHSLRQGAGPHGWSGATSTVHLELPVCCREIFSLPLSEFRDILYSMLVV